GLAVSGGTAIATSHRATDVLVQPPESRRYVGDLMTFGVWYQSYSGGPRRYSLSVYSPRGRRVFYVAGAATTKWRIYRYAPQDVGLYRTVFTLSSGKYAYKTRVFIGD